MQDTRKHKPLIDIAMLRETLAYIRDDLRRVPEMRRAADLLSAALGEIATAERRRLASVPLSVIDARWLRRRKQ